MAYQIRRDYTAHAEKYQPEEEDVKLALKEYSDDDRKGVTDADFCTTDLLYRTYRLYVARYAHHPGDPDTLTREQFAVALRVVFPELEVDGRHARICVDGFRRWGYRHIRGPGSIIAREGRGRPPKDVRQASPAAPEVQSGDEAPADEEF